MVDVFKNPDWPDEVSGDDNASKKSRDSFSSRGLTGRGMGQNITGDELGIENVSSLREG